MSVKSILPITLLHIYLSSFSHSIFKNFKFHKFQLILL